ncbi:MAG: aminoglycoside phosphotransferase family protein [Clostridium sp.]|nr:aminoglycoside phosphotransferase family protein [Clostridium sp.]
MIKSRIEMPSFKEKLKWNIKESPLLEETVKEEILRRLERLPEGNRLCHGDYHPGNIMFKGEEPIVIDWMTACKGDPLADIARTMVVLSTAIFPNETPNRERIMIEKDNIVNLYKAEYVENEEKLNEWMLPLLAGRLNEHMSDEENKIILKWIQDLL